MRKKTAMVIALVLASCTSQQQITPSKTTFPSDSDLTSTFASTLTPIPSPATSNTITPTITINDAANIPENAMIAYVGDQSIDVISAIRGSFLPVIENYETTYYKSPSWSPSGDQIVFGSFGPDIHPKISIINRDGSGLRILSENIETDPAWSPDGEQIAYVIGTGLYVVRSNGQELQQLAGSESPINLFPAWSPDGKQLALLGDSGGPKNPYKIFVINSDGSNLHAITEAIVGRSHITWSPDGNKIAFRSFEGCGDINALDLTTGLITDLTNTPRVIELDPAWSPDGNYIAFSRAFYTPCEQDQVEGNQGGSLYIMKANGQDITQLPTKDGGSQPSWWPTVVLQQNWKYTVTKAGANLNVRESPATSAKSLLELPQGAIFTALDGPQEADGYSWWHIRTHDGVEGWCVDVPGWYMFESAP